MPASESTSNRGEWCEDFALKKFQKQEYQLIGKNKKWAGVEVDLLLFKHHFLMVEVKAISDLEHLPIRVSQVQLNRLLRARHWIADYYANDVKLIFFFVKNKKEWIELCAEDLL